MGTRLVAASGALMAAAAIAGSAATAYADDAGNPPDPVMGASSVDAASSNGADQAGQPAPAQANQVSSIGTSIGTSMAMMGPMMGIYVPMMVAPMLLGGAGAAALSPVAPLADAVAPIADAVTAPAAAASDLGTDFGLNSVPDVTSDLASSSVPDLTPDLDLSSVLDPTPGLGTGLSTGSNVVSSVLGFFGF